MDLCFLGRTKEYMKKNSGRIIGIGILAVVAIALAVVVFVLNQKDKQNVAVVRKEPETQTVQNPAAAVHDGPCFRRGKTERSIEEQSVSEVSGSGGPGFCL